MGGLGGHWLRWAGPPGEGKLGDWAPEAGGEAASLSVTFSLRNSSRSMNSSVKSVPSNGRVLSHKLGISIADCALYPEPSASLPSLLLPSAINRNTFMRNQITKPAQKEKTFRIHCHQRNKENHFINGHLLPWVTTPRKLLPVPKRNKENE
jgi:hypothetical protein